MYIIHEKAAPFWGSFPRRALCSARCCVWNTELFNFNFQLQLLILSAICRARSCGWYSSTAVICFTEETDHFLYYDRGTLWGRECFHLSLCRSAPHFRPPPFYLPLRLRVPFFHSFSSYFSPLGISLCPRSCLFPSQIRHILPPPHLPFPTVSLPHGDSQLYPPFDSSSIFSCRRTEHSCPSKSCKIPTRGQAHPFLPTLKTFPVLSFLPIFHQLFLVFRLTSQLGASSPIDRGLVWLAVENH